MIIQIALGIVLAVLILAFLPKIIALGLAGLAVVAVLAVVVGLVAWLPNALPFIVGAALVFYATWKAIQISKKHNEKDAQDMQQGQGKSATGLTWHEQVSEAERNKLAAKSLIFGGGFSVLCLIGGYQLGWGPLGMLGFIALPLAIFCSVYAKQRQTKRCYVTTPGKIRAVKVPTPEAVEEGRQRGW